MAHEQSACNYSNPKNLSLEELSLNVTNSGIVQQFKALDPYWVENREMTIYERPPSTKSLVQGSIDAWKSKMEIYLEDLKWLLTLEYHRFWSNILYHPNCLDALVSFLQEAYPPYIHVNDNQDVQKLYREIRRLVLIIFSRLITNKESKSHWMNKEFMANLIYNNFIFTIPIIWDLCLVYGIDNPQHIGRLLESIFMLQPQYERDAVAAVAFVKEAFKYIILQVNKDFDSEEPPNLPETFKGFGEIRRPSNTKLENCLTFNVIRDIVIHLLDTAMTSRIFLETFPKSVDIFRKTNFVLSTVQLYEYGIPLLYEKLLDVCEENSAQHREVEGYLDLARSELIDIFREILAVYKNAIFSGQGNIANHVEDYLAVMMDGLSEKLLIKDYHSCYPVHEDLEMLKQAYPEIDSVKTDFILQAIYSNLDEVVPEERHNSVENMTNGHIETIDCQSIEQPGSSNETEIPDHIKEESLISEVRDILPHLGDGFILKCLKHYGFRSERVINSILEDNLDDSLKGIDQTLPIIPEDPLDKKFLETGIQRLNIFDGDQFDIMTRDDVDLSKIHIGKKKSKYKDLKDMLDDKTEINKLDIYTKYNLVCDEEAMYSDEYDDTYDSDGAGVVPTADSTEDPRRPFVTPRALQRHARDQETEESEESDHEEVKPSTSSGNRNKMDFCQNPEEIRARRQASFDARRGKGHRPPPAKNADVVGKARGQGQEKEVLVNRDRKEKQKSSRGNHNRRQGAQWKRSQGLMPS